MGSVNIEEDHHPCVNICSGASIKIIDDYIWPDIETLKTYKFIGFTVDMLFY